MLEFALEALGTRTEVLAACIQVANLWESWSPPPYGMALDVLCDACHRIVADGYSLDVSPVACGVRL